MHNLLYGETTIEFEVAYSDRKTLEIAVLPDQSVYVKAPKGKDLEAVLERVRKRARWIVKQQSYFASVGKSFTRKEYVSGESFRYLGRQYRLKVLPLNSVQGGDTPTGEHVKMTGGYIRVYTHRKDDTAHIRGLLDRWYRTHAKRKFEERVKICSRVMEKYKIKGPLVQIRAMKNRWGSFTPSGKILLNPRLIEWPTYCIDYVILHELCHLKHPNHGRQFYQLLKKVLPEWEEIKKRLEQ